MGNAVVQRFLAIIPAVAIAAALGLGRDSLVYGEDTLWETITAVRENESLYANLDVLVRCTYEIGDPKLHSGGGFFNVEDPTPDADAASSDASGRSGAFRLVSQFASRFVSQRSETFHFVSQEGMLRLDWKGTSTHDDDTVRSWHRILLFDGTTTRLHDEAPLGDCYRASGILKEATIRPHALLFPWADRDTSLSDYLEGRQDREVSYQGKEELDGLKCRRVRITHLSGRPQKPTIHTDLWLAEERNLIPVRRLEYKLRWSEELPHADAAVDQWREIRPGVWFPVAAAKTVYNTTALEREKVQKLQWREQYTVERVSLDPEHEITFFRELDVEERAAEKPVREAEQSKRTGTPTLR